MYYLNCDDKNEFEYALESCKELVLVIIKLRWNVLIM